MFRVGDVEADLTLDRTPFQAGLRAARMEAQRFEREGIKATVNVDAANAERRLEQVSHDRTIKADLDLDTAAAEAKLLLLQRQAASIGGGVGGVGGGGSGGGGILGPGGFFKPSPLIAGGALAASFLPTLGASAAQGALGAGALGLGLGGAGAVGGAGILATALPAVAHLKELSKAQTDYNGAVQQYGKNSKEARQALRSLDQVQRSLPQSASQVTDSLDQIESRWAQLSMPGQRDFFGILHDGLQTVSHDLPMFAQVSNSAMGAARDAADHFFHSLEGADFHTFVTQMSDLFDKGIGPTEAGLENIFHVLGRIAVAVAPDVLNMLQGFASATHQWEQNTRDAGQLQHHVHETVQQFGNWFDLATSLGHLLSALFITNQEGARKGGQEVEAVAHQLDQWARWIEHHHHDITHFFGQLNDDVGLLLDSAGQIASVVLPAFRPVADIIHEIVTDLNSIKVGNVSALTVLLGAMTARSLGGRVGLGGTPVPVGGGEGGGARGFGRGSGPLAALIGGAAVLQHFRHAQQAVEDDSTSFGDKIKTVYEDAFPPIKTEVDLASKALSVFGVGNDTAAATISTFADSVHGGNRAVRAMQKQIDGLSTSSAADAITSLKDHYGDLVNAGHHMSAQQRQAWIDIALQARKSGDITQDQLQHLTTAFGNNSQRWQHQMEAAARVTGESTRQIANSVGDSAVHVSKTYDGMVKVVGGGLNWLTSNTSRAAQALGVHQDVQFHANPQAFHGGGDFGHRAAGALGGFLPGYSAHDNIHLMARGGEAILRPEDHVPIVSRALQATYGFGLRDLFARTGSGVVDRTGVRHFARGGMNAMVNEANRFEAHHFPYAWGGGHSGFGIEPVDCSGAVSDVLHAGGLLSSPMVSGQLMSWGRPGTGALTVYANPEHTFMRLGSRYFGTSSSNPGGGAGWVEGGYPAGYLSGFTARTAPVTGAVMDQIRRLILYPRRPMESHPGQGALDTTWRAANRFLAQHAGGQFGGGQALNENAWRGINSASEFIPFWNRENPDLKRYGPTFSYIVPAESGWNPHASNGTHFGWYQFDAPTWSQFKPSGAPQAPEGPFDPGLATLGAGNVIRHEGVGGFSRWATFHGLAQRGGFLDAAMAGWHGNGGDFTVDRPTIFGAGEKGREHVSIRPAGSDRRPVISVHVHIAPGSGAAEWEDRVHTVIEDAMDEYGSLDGALARAR